MEKNEREKNEMAKNEMEQKRAETEQRDNQPDDREAAAAEGTAAPQEAPAPGAAEKRQMKKAAKKEKKKQKKLERKALRRRVRERRKEEFRARGCLGKALWFLGKLAMAAVILVLLATVVQVNYIPVSRFILQTMISFYRNVDMDSVTQEQLAQILPVDEEGAAAIDVMAPNAEGETWAIYMYMVGSDLESSSMSQLSDATRYYTGISAENYTTESKKITRDRLTGFMQEIMDKGLDLPTFFYKKPVSDGIPGWMYTLMNNVLGGESEEFYAASKDIEEMLKVKLPQNVKVVFQPGGAGEWAYERINPNRTQRFVYDADGVHEVYNEQITGMARTQTLADFLLYCVEEHPADHTMVLFWNHGGGAFGYGVDTLFGGDMLTLSEMREAFESVCTADEENPPFDIIGFDACLMASLEVAQTFNGFADYMLGSEDVEPGYGWDYTAWLGALAENPQMTPLQLGKAVTDSYIDYYCRYGEAANQPATQLFSIIDLSKADDLYAAYERLMARALDDAAENPGIPAMLGKCANSAIKYADDYHDYYNTLDLGMFMEEVAAYYPDEAKAVHDLVGETVLYNLACGIYKESQGITVHYPSTIANLEGILQALMYIDDICMSEDIRTLYYYKVAGCLRDDMQEYVQGKGYGEILPMDPAPLRAMTKAPVTIREDQSFTIAADPAALALTQNMEYRLFDVQADGSARGLGSSLMVTADAENNLSAAFDGKWLHLDGQILPVKVISTTQSMVTCSAEITYNAETAYLMLGYDVQAQTWKILGVHDREIGANQILAPRTTNELKAGDIITPVYTTYNMETGASGEKKGEAITYTESNKVEMRTLRDGEYMACIRLIDARGDEYNLPVVSFSLKDGAMKDAKAGESYNITAL